jgi:hypothetical protein
MGPSLTHKDLIVVKILETVKRISASLLFQRLTNSNIPEGTQLSGYGSKLYIQELDRGENSC